MLADTLRADYLGCHGFQGDISPNVDRLAAEGLLFERCFSQAPWTKPSVASLFTSLHPEIHGVTTHHGWFGEDRSVARQDVGPSSGRTDVLPDEALTLAEVLRTQGYETAAFVANPWIQRDQGFAQGFETYEEVETKRGRPLVDRALAWLQARADERPFFLYLHFMDVHGPYDAPDKDYAALKDSSSLGDTRTLDERELRRLPEHLRGVPWTGGPEGRDLRAWRGRYAAGVRALDRHVGAFVDELRTANRLDSTLLVFTSDHGEELLEHGGWDHGESLHEDQTHVPLIVRLPGAARAGERLSSVTSLIDVPPTILALAKLSVPADFQGHDASSLGTSDAFSVASAVKWRPELLALRTARHRLVCDLERETQTLYDLEKDPREATDLAPSEPELARTLRERLQSHLERLAAREPLTPGELEVSTERAARLKDLGY